MCIATLLCFSIRFVQRHRPVVQYKNCALSQYSQEGVSLNTVIKLS